MQRILAVANDCPIIGFSTSCWMCCVFGHSGPFSWEMWKKIQHIKRQTMRIKWALIFTFTSEVAVCSVAYSVKYSFSFFFKFSFVIISLICSLTLHCSPFAISGVYVIDVTDTWEMMEFSLMWGERSCRRYDEVKLKSWLYAISRVDSVTDDDEIII